MQYKIIHLIFLTYTPCEEKIFYSFLCIT